MPETEFNQYDVDPFAESRKRRKRILFFSIPILLLAIYAVWANFLSYGWIKVTGQPPFDIIILGENSMNCAVSPCVFKLNTGSYDIDFYKFGYSSDTAKISISLWSTVSLAPVFKRDPYLEETTDKPNQIQTTNRKTYTLKYDAKYHNYKLTAEHDDKAVSYFPNPIVSPQIIGTDNAVLVVERDPSMQKNPVFYIDANSKIQKIIGEIDYEIIGAKASPNGRNFLILARSKDKKTSTKLIDSSAIYDANVSSFETSSWNISNELIHFEPVASPGTDKISDWQIFLGAKMLYKVTNLSAAPSEIIPDASGNKIYFKSGEKTYRLNF